MSRKRILLIDDEADLCRVMKMNLERGGEIEVAIAHTGSEGVAKAQAAPFDLVITDYNLPGMNGEAVLDALKALRPDMAVVVFSVYHDDATHITSSLHRKADGILTKPLDHRELATVIDRLLGPPATGGDHGGR